MHQVRRYSNGSMMGSFEDVKTVVVPGCGRGHEVVELARRGFEVTAIDFAPAAIEALSTKLAEQRHVGYADPRQRF